MVLIPSKQAILKQLSDPMPYSNSCHFSAIARSSHRHTNNYLLDSPNTFPHRRASKALRAQRMGPPHPQVYLVMMAYDPEYERLRADRNRSAAQQLDKYVKNKHDMLLQRTLKPGTYKKRFSWVIVDGFAAEITSEQAEKLRCADEVRVVEKDQEIGM